MFKFILKNAPVLRAAAVVSVVGALVTSVTYATLQSPTATLTGNTIQSASADLRIGTSATSFAASRTGFTFQDVVPGGPAMPATGNIFYLKNYGTATLAVKLGVGTTPTNAAGVDLTKVSVNLTRIDTNATQTFSLQSLIDGYATGGTALTDSIAPGVVAQYKISVSMAADAFTGNSASIGGIDFVFSATALLNS